MATVNYDKVRKKLMRAIVQDYKTIKPLVKKCVEERKEMFLQKVDNLNISKELMAGPKATNSILPKGNLFSYLGFKEGTQPYQELRAVLYDKTYYRDNLRFSRISGPKLFFKFSVEFPDGDYIESKTKLPWGDGPSWVRALEKTGMDNFNYYLFAMSGGLRNSRSGTGLQIGNEINKIQSITPRPYVLYEIQSLITDMRRAFNG